MTYVTGDIPVGDYDPIRLANLGIGHGAIDSGNSYTYFNPATGYEFSGVAGFTHNSLHLANPCFGRSFRRACQRSSASNA
jgi:hypothetical protein